MEAATGKMEASICPGQRRKEVAICAGQRRKERQETLCVDGRGRRVKQLMKKINVFFLKIKCLSELWKQRQDDLCEFKASLYHIMNSRSAKAT